MSNRQFSIYIKNNNGNVKRKLVNKGNQKKAFSRRKRGAKRKGARRSKLKPTTKSKWNIVKNSISNISMTENRKKFLNLIENRNTTTYRTLKKKFFSQHKLDLKKRYFFDIDFDDVLILSLPSESASNSIVYKLKKGRKQYILKVTGMEHIEGKYSAPDVENKIYSIMSILIEKKITPHIFSLVTSSNKEIPISVINSSFRTEIENIFRNPKIKFLYPMVVETSDSSKEITTLHDFLLTHLNILPKEKKNNIFIILLFQIMYTLEIFNRIGIKHNDLHLKNIFVQINKKNYINDNNEIYFNKYTLDKSYLIPNIGINIRIFDFDRTCKLNNSIFPEYGYIESKKIPQLNDININCLENPSFDTYKVIGEIYHRMHKDKYNFDNEMTILENFFSSDGINLLKSTDFYHDGVFYKDLFYKGHRYYLINKPISESLMMNTNKICQFLGNSIEKNFKKGNIEIFQEFSFNNI